MVIYSKKIGKTSMHRYAQVIYSFLEHQVPPKLFSAITYLSVSDTRYSQNPCLSDMHTFVGL